MPGKKIIIASASVATALALAGVVQGVEEILAPGEIQHCQNMMDYALTFDDGPDPSSTPALLDILKKHNVKATFFELGSLMQGAPEVVKRIVAEGHVIGSHTWSHADLGNLTKQGNLDAVRQEVQKNEDMFTSILGAVPVLFRYPYGSFSPESDSIVKGEFKKTPIYWNVDTKDFDIQAIAPGNISSQVPVQIASGLNGGPISLQHDIYINSVNQVETIILWGKSNGYTFKTVAECNGIQNPWVVKDATKFNSIVGAPKPSPTPDTPIKPAKAVPGASNQKSGADATTGAGAVSAMLTGFAAFAVGLLNFF